MKRRAFLASGGAVTLTAVSGCLDSGGQDDDNKPASTPGPPGTPRPFDVDSFETTTTNGVDVPLAPVEVTYNWHYFDEARFVDARGQTSYNRSHIEGAVLSPAPDGPQNDPDPVADWPTDTRIVAYCGCPHHLSSMRAASLIKNGYENVAVIDEGFTEWQRRGYPMAGSNVDLRPPAYEISGQTDAAYAGESAWAFHDPTGQREATPIDSDGSYRLELKFADISEDSPIRVTTPEYEIERSLGELTGSVVTGQ